MEEQGIARMEEERDGLVEESGRSCLESFLIKGDKESSKWKDLRVESFSIEVEVLVEGADIFALRP